MNDPKDDVITYMELLADLHILVSQGKKNTEEADKIRDKMDGPWFRISHEDMLRLNWISVKINTIHDIVKKRKT